MENPEKNNPKQPKSNPFMRFSGMGFQMITVILLSTWGGMKLDAYWGFEKPWMTISLILIGVMGSMFILIKGVIGQK